MSESYHHIANSSLYVQVILPMAVPKAYTYYVPSEFANEIAFGKRVEVQFGRSKLYAGLVVDILKEKPDFSKVKPILSVIDDAPIFNPNQWKFWRWMANYYLCSIGEVMNAALPANLKLSSESILGLNPVLEPDYNELDDKEYLIIEALGIQEELTLKDVQGILGKKSVYGVIRQLLEKRLIIIKENLKNKYKPKLVGCLRFTPMYEDTSALAEAFDKTSRSEKQTAALLAYIQLSKQQEDVTKKSIYKMANIDSSVIAAMVKKDIFETYEKVVSRIAKHDKDIEDSGELSEQQQRAIDEINQHFNDDKVVLLHGVTGSGKTRLYAEFIEDIRQQGQQALYLLPEIALTTQMISRLKKIFGDDIVVYHSKLSNNERVEIWNAVLAGQSIVVGPRSSLFLPFIDLKLIVVDEEHDPSYKQHDPAPRYHGRDAAILLAHLHQAKVILGTATPSLESYYNAKKGKFGLVEMKERFGGIALPQIHIVDALKQYKQQKMQAMFTDDLMIALKQALANEEQAILFQNRRGYSPVFTCNNCGWHVECIHCDVSLTWHQYQNQLKCHYCSYQTKLPESCPSCGSRELALKGHGTEKIEDELKIFLPEANINRFDLETARTQTALNNIIHQFEDKEIDILVGTQMVTKGLDFDNVSIVGIINADKLLQFPDFRASERAFQLMVQVSGRAGRKKKQGQVLIQAFNLAHPVLKEVQNGDYTAFYQREIAERQQFGYPPFKRLIYIHLKHKTAQTLNRAMSSYSQFLKSKLGDKVLGPSVPMIPRVRGLYILDVMIKTSANIQEIRHIKQIIKEANIYLTQMTGMSNIRIVVDIDPN